jgi:hypothetical protein
MFAYYHKRSRRLRAGMCTTSHHTRQTAARETTGSTSGMSHLPSIYRSDPMGSTAVPYGRLLSVARKSVDWRTSAKSLFRHGLISWFGLSLRLHNARSGACETTLIPLSAREPLFVEAALCMMPLRWMARETHHQRHNPATFTTKETKPAFLKLRSL